MVSNEIFLPVLSMALLTALVWSLVIVSRVFYMNQNNILGQSVHTQEKMMSTMSERVNYPAHNLKNLFELPVLFYAVCFIAYLTQSVDQTFIAAAWSFFILRAIHSLIQCTYNIVNHRFVPYFLSSCILWFLAVKLLITLID